MREKNKRANGKNTLMEKLNYRQTFSLAYESVLTSFALPYNLESEKVERFHTCYILWGYITMNNIGAGYDALQLQTETMCVMYISRDHIQGGGKKIESKRNTQKETRWGKNAYSTQKNRPKNNR